MMMGPFHKRATLQFSARAFIIQKQNTGKQGHKWLHGHINTTLHLMKYFIHSSDQDSCLD